MPKLTSSLENTKAFVAAEAGWLPMKCILCEVDNKAKVPTVRFDTQVLDSSDKYPNRKFMFNNFIYGGINEKTKEPYSLNGMLNILGSFGVPYECGACNAEQSEAPVRDKTDYRCPTCKEVIPSVNFNTEDLVGKMADGNVTLENSKTYVTDGDGNQKLIDSTDDEGLPIKRNAIRQWATLGKHSDKQAA